ncbi:MAG: HNH endonuclease [Candidatus Dormibacteria bacterium]
MRSILSYHNAKKVKNIISKCEIKDCTVTDPKLLEVHHIIPQRNKDSNNEFSHYINNLACLCPTHHRMTEIGELIIEGRFKTTEGNILIYKFNKR